MPQSILSSPTLMTEFWVERMIGYALSNQAMTALTSAMTRLRDGYEWDKKSYETAIGQQFVTALATAPEFMLR